MPSSKYYAAKHEQRTSNTSGSSNKGRCQYLMVQFSAVMVVATAMFSGFWFHSRGLACLDMDGGTGTGTAPEQQQQQHQEQQPQDPLSTVYKIPHHQLRSTIREWGCHRKETPFVFVHIGKAGGGAVRARMATSSLNYSADVHWEKNHGAYFPISDTEKGYLCSSCYPNRRPTAEYTFEATVPCHAQTPIGKAIACPREAIVPKVMRQTNHRPVMEQCSSPTSSVCHMVYLGHNLIGSEFYWLPTNYLQNWWQTILTPHQRQSPFFKHIPWHRLEEHQIWCDALNRTRPVENPFFVDMYEACSVPLAHQVDTLSNVAFSPHQDGLVPSWAPLYASLPVLRVTVLREPFSWIMSKFFWHSQQLNFTCDDIEASLGRKKFYPAGIDYPRFMNFNLNGRDPWLKLLCLDYISYLCGEDCLTRYAAGRITWEGLERQAEENLRHSFAVVGILEEVEDFYQMLTARIHYMDTTLNLQAWKVAAKKEGHQTGMGGESGRCKVKFKRERFQQQLLNASPELRAIQRLYQVAKEVKTFQIQELKKCSPSTFS